MRETTLYLQRASDLDLGQLGAQMLLDLGIEPLRIWSDLYLVGAKIRRALFGPVLENAPRELQFRYASIMSATVRVVGPADNRHLATAACRLAVLDLFLQREAEHLAAQA